MRVFWPKTYTELRWPVARERQENKGVRGHMKESHRQGQLGPFLYNTDMSYKN